MIETDINIKTSTLKYYTTIINLPLVIKTLINVIFIKIDNINVIGAVIGSIVSFAVVTVCNHISLQKYFDVRIPIIRQGKTPLISAIIMSLALLLFRYQLVNNFIKENYTRLNIGILTVTLIIIGAITYAITLLMLGGISKYELDTISPKIYNILPNKLKNKVI